MRLNKDDNMMKYGFIYDVCCFIVNGFMYNDFYFEDGGIFIRVIIKKFMRVVD